MKHLKAFNESSVIDQSNWNINQEVEVFNNVKQICDDVCAKINNRKQEGLVVKDFNNTVWTLYVFNGWWFVSNDEQTRFITLGNDVYHEHEKVGLEEYLDLDFDNTCLLVDLDMRQPELFYGKYIDRNNHIEHSYYYLSHNNMKQSRLNGPSHIILDFNDLKKSKLEYYIDGKKISKKFATSKKENYSTTDLQTDLHKMLKEVPKLRYEFKGVYKDKLTLVIADGVKFTDLVDFLNTIRSFAASKRFKIEIGMQQYTLFRLTFIKTDSNIEAAPNTGTEFFA